MFDFKFTKGNYRSFKELRCVGTRKVNDHWHILLEERRFDIGNTYICTKYEDMDDQTLRSPNSVYVIDSERRYVGFTPDDLNRGKWVFYPEDLLSEKDKFALRLLDGIE